jgi:hypothetical protein
VEVNLRQEARRADRKTYTLNWQSDDGNTYSVEGHGVDISRSGLRVVSPVRLGPETIVFVQAHGGPLSGNAVVRHCTVRGEKYALGLALNEHTMATVSFEDGEDTDYYAFLQVSAKADWPPFIASTGSWPAASTPTTRKPATPRSF